MNTQSPNEYLSRQAKNMAVTKASSTVENWLNQYGTAQIGVQPGDKLSQSTLSADMLLPCIKTRIGSSSPSSVGETLMSAPR